MARHGRQNEVRKSEYPAEATAILGREVLVIDALE